VGDAVNNNGAKSTIVEAGEQIDTNSAQKNLQVTKEKKKKRKKMPLPQTIKQGQDKDGNPI